MDNSFSQGLKLNSLTSTTSLVIWSMIIFLIALIIGISIIFRKQFKNIEKVKNNKLSDRSNSKGFQVKN